jgi:ketosteroid isomerase-like protein
MKKRIIILPAFLLTLFTINLHAQTEKEAVEKVMKAYKDGVQNLSAKGLSDLFTKDSEVFESGGVEGSFDNYLEHHLGPELGHFKSFTFSENKIETKVDLPYAFTTETYIYTIVLIEGDRTIKKKGVATSVLKKEGKNWKIVKTHTSSRNPK